MPEPILSHREGPALILTINRPDDLNRINRYAMLALVRALDDADTDASIRAIVITGSEEYFCAGGRIDGHPGGTVTDQLKFAQSFCSLQERMGRISAPIIAAVGGHERTRGL